jgi:type II secretory pathway pseudopilin PulG
MKWYYKLLAVLVLIGIIAAGLFALYSSGVNAGKLIGDKEGYTRAWNAQQTVIDKLVKDTNDERTAKNAKISKLEQDASIRDAKINTLTLQNQTHSASVIAEYVKANATTSTTCGMDKASMDALIEIMGVQK